MSAELSARIGCATGIPWPLASATDLSGLALGTTTSAAEQVAQWAPGARVVKAFNTVGSNIMADPSFGSNRALLFYCGDDAAAKQTVKSLAGELGFDAQDSGPLRQARLLEPFALLWISLAYGQGYGREFAFQLIASLAPHRSLPCCSGGRPRPRQD
jgi:predicted dinucleotide-binding enzyme